MSSSSRKGPSLSSVAAAQTAGVAALKPKTLRLVIDLNHRAGVARFDWCPFGEDQILSYPSSEDTDSSRQETHSLRAFAIALLCVEHCRQNGPTDLTKLKTLNVDKHLQGWRIQRTEAEENWLQTLGAAYETRQATPRKALGKILDQLRGLLDGQDPEWTASRARPERDVKASFKCRDACVTDIGASAKTAGPKLLFRLASATEDLPAGSDFLALARQLEDGNGDWTHKLLSPPPNPPPPDLLPGIDELLQAFTASLDATASDCSELVTRGISLGGDPLQKPLRLARVYVNLDTTSLRSSEKEKASQPAENKAPLSALEALFDPLCNRIVLVGEPGSGKSTFLQYVTLCLADAFCAQPGRPSHLADLEVPELLRRQKLIPLRILLREFALILEPGQPGSRQHVERLLCDQVGETAAAQLGTVLKRGLAFVLFDGLDEVPKDRVPAVRQAIESFARDDYRQCRIAVTCRTKSYRKKTPEGEDEFRLSRFPEPCEIAPLTPRQQADFVHAWYAELEEVQSQFRGQGADCAVSLLNALVTERLREMAGNPFFLTAMAAMHRPDKRLPDTSAELMHQLVNSVLEESSKRSGQTKPGELELACLLKDVREGFKILRLRLEAIAYAARERRKDQDHRFIDDDLLRSRLLLDNNKVNAAWVGKLLDVLLHRAGLLQSPDGQRFEFAYRFEEFLAGCHLANRDAWVKSQPSFVRRTRDLLKQQGDYARQVVIWAAGVNAHVQFDRSSVRELASDLTPRGAAKGASLADLELAADIARDAGMDHWQDEDVPDTSDTVSRLRSRLEEVRDGVALFNVQDRSRAASAIGRLGDLRSGVGLLPSGLPDLVFETQEFPAGEFTVAKTGQKVTIPQRYQISRYPVTVAQYQAFVAAGGYTDDRSDEATQRLTRWWMPEGLEWKRDNNISGPEDSKAVFQTPNHPRVGVSWFEATAFCGWLTERLRAAPPNGSQQAMTTEGNGTSPAWLPPEQAIRLPHEAEWEQAARWNQQAGRADDRFFPWGDEAADLAQRCNMDKTGLGHTSAVGLFPSGQASCGAMDLAGNVWEWCENCYDNNQNYRVLRGGSWDYDHPERLRCSSRNYVGYPDHRLGLYGFRCVWCLGGSAPG